MKNDDWESGSFVPTPNPLRDSIIKSLSDKHYQTATHLCHNTGGRLDDVLAIIENDADIDYKLVGSLTVYYLKQNAPAGRLINTGNHSFEVETETAIKTFTAKRKRNYPTPVRDKFKPEIIEQFAFEQKSLNQIAAALQVSYPSVKNFLYSNDLPEIKAAYLAGKARRKLQLKSSPVKQPPPPPVQTISENDIPEKPAIGQVETEPRFDPLTEHLETNGNGAGISKLEAEMKQITETKIVQLSGGRSVRIDSDFNILLGTQRERQFMDKIATLVERFETGKIM
jgi:hypothetical protein